MAMTEEEKQAQLTLGQTRTQAWELVLLRAQTTVKPSGGNMLNDTQWILNEYTIIMRDLFAMNMATCQVYPSALGDLVKKKCTDLKDAEVKRLTANLG